MALSADAPAACCGSRCLSSKTGAATNLATMTAPVPSTPPPDWPAQAADAIVRNVDKVRNKTTVPARTAAKGLKYGPAVATFISVISVLLLIGSLRFFERLLIKIGDTWSVSWLAEPMWMIYTLFGVVFTCTGWRLWSKAKI